MKCLLLIVLILFSIPVCSQDGTDTGKNNRRAKAELTPATLAEQLTISCTTDLEKVRAIFYWIAGNIAYRTGPVAARNRKRSSAVLMDEDSDTAALKPLDERVAETVLEERVAVCDGYARLFKTLCNYSGIQAEVIHGYARTEATKRIQRFRPNHSWNAVLIDSTWQLLDVTWASGYITWQGYEFVRQLDQQYFLTRPEEFIREHYPDDLRWALMEDPPLMPEFRHSPFKQKSFSKYQITTYTPGTGVIEATQGDTISIELVSANLQKDHTISSDPFLDTAIYSTSSAALLRPRITDQRISYSYVANQASVQWLYILYNNDVILRYRLKVKMTTPLSMAAGLP